LCKSKVSQFSKRIYFSVIDAHRGKGRGRGAKNWHMKMQ
jgi:hypothetical protein